MTTLTFKEVSTRLDELQAKISQGMAEMKRNLAEGAAVTERCRLASEAYLGNRTPATWAELQAAQEAWNKNNRSYHRIDNRLERLRLEIDALLPQLTTAPYE